MYRLDCSSQSQREGFVIQNANPFWLTFWKMIFPHCVRWERFSSSGSQTGRATNHIPTSWRSVSWQGSWPLSISRPLGFFLCQIWTIIRPPGLLEPHLLISTQIFSLTTQPSTIVLFLIEQSLSKSICGHFCGNFFWQRLLLRSDCFLSSSSL